MRIFYHYCPQFAQTRDVIEKVLKRFDSRRSFYKIAALLQYNRCILFIMAVSSCKRRVSNDWIVKTGMRSL
jgi:hypothetical protein